MRSRYLSIFQSLLLILSVTFVESKYVSSNSNDNFNDNDNFYNQFCQFYPYTITPLNLFEAHKTTLSTDARLTLRWKNDTGFDKHMCNVSISNKTTEAFDFLTGTMENMELKPRGPLLTNVLKLRNMLQCTCGLISVTHYARA